MVWSMNSAEYFTLLVRERGWAPDRFAAWLSDAWIRLFLASARGLTSPASALATALCRGLVCHALTLSLIYLY